MKLGLSIDWDAFFDMRTVEQNDWGHTEHPTLRRLFNYDLWRVRAMQQPTLQDTYLPKAFYTSFWPELARRGFVVDERTKFALADSHRYAYHWFRQHGVDTVLSFDNHHDLGYGNLAGDEALDLDGWQTLLLAEELGQMGVTCENWLGCLRTHPLAPTLARATVLYPTWTRERGVWRDVAAYWRETVRRPVDFAMWDELANARALYGKDRVHVGVLFLARSGGWTPPWGDDAFQWLAQSCPAYRSADIYDASAEDPLFRPWQRIADDAWLQLVAPELSAEERAGASSLEMARRLLDHRLAQVKAATTAAQGTTTEEAVGQ